MELEALARSGGAPPLDVLPVTAPAPPRRLPELDLRVLPPLLPAPSRRGTRLGSVVSTAGAASLQDALCTPRTHRASFRDFVRALPGWAERATAAQAWARRHGDAYDGICTYWFDGVTSGLLRWRGSRERPRIVTRAHGVDLWVERRAQPHRRRDLAMVDAVFPVSGAGCRYLVEQGAPAERVRIARLGVPGAPDVARGTGDALGHQPAAGRGRCPERPYPARELRLVSAASLIPLKRVHRIAEVAAALARADPARTVRWAHVGAGPDRPRVEAALALAPGNLVATLHGELSNAALRDVLRSGAHHAFVHLSETEGLPVVLMEACEAGLPLVATDVGGVGEIVDDTVGRLVPAAAPPEVVAAAVEAVARSAAALGTAARNRWRADYDVDANAPEFWRELAASAATGPDSRSSTLSP